MFNKFSNIVGDKIKKLDEKNGGLVGKFLPQGGSSKPPGQSSSGYPGAQYQQQQPPNSGGYSSNPYQQPYQPTFPGNAGQPPNPCPPSSGYGAPAYPPAGPGAMPMPGQSAPGGGYPSYPPTGDLRNQYPPQAGMPYQPSGPGGYPSNPGGPPGVPVAVQPYSPQHYANAPPPQGPGPQGMHIAPPGSTYHANQQGHAGGVYTQDVGGYHMTLSNCQGRKKAVFIGINYFNTQAELKGCINDVKNISEFLFSRKGFRREDCVFLTDDQQDPKFIPTRANIQAACGWLVNGSQPGDSLFFHYSGHGGTQRDTNGDEADGYDETILPVDYKRAGQITDDDLNLWLVRVLPAGVRLTSVFDSCHSGTVLDLPYTYNCDGSIQVVTSTHNKDVAMSLLNAGLTFQRGDTLGAVNKLVGGIKKFAQGDRTEEADRITKETKGTTADVVMFSGCRDDQTSADAHIDNRATGAMSHALIQVLSQNSGPLTYTQLLFSVRDILKGRFKQIPQMSTGRPMDMNTQFII
ncbi:hypothetical protein IWQ61_000038 [Dispira simplex]|nr:hypothetical protein IWQ61_000038 [Dispira simplex]